MSWKEKLGIQFFFSVLASFLIWQFVPSGRALNGRAGMCAAILCVIVAVVGISAAVSQKDRRAPTLYVLGVVLLGLLPTILLVTRALVVPALSATTRALPAEASAQPAKNDALSRIRQYQYNIDEPKRLSRKLNVQCSERGSWECLTTLRTLAADPELVNQINALNSEKIEVRISERKCLTDLKYLQAPPGGEIHHASDEVQHAYVRLNLACTREQYRQFLLGTP